MSAAGPQGPPVAVHQFVPTLNPHDATGTHTLLLRDILRGAGWRSEIFAEAIHDDLAAEALQALEVPRPRGRRATCSSTSSPPRRRWPASWPIDREPLIVDFHNFTAPELFAGWEPHTEARCALAHGELVMLAGRAELGLADSHFNELDLRRAGYRRTAVLPVLVDYRRVGTGAPSDARVAAELASLKERGGADILFVGRIVPSKGQHELVKAFWAYRRLYDPAARLHLVGGTSSFAYLKALRGFIRDLGLADAVRLTGEISDAALRAYFQRRRRLPLALGARGVRGAAHRGHGGRSTRCRPRCRARWPRRSVTARSFSRRTTRRTWPPRSGVSARTRRCATC